MKQLKISIIDFLIMSLLARVIYPLIMTGIAQILFSKKANGSLITINGQIIGSELIGQKLQVQNIFTEGRRQMIMTA